MNKKEEKINSIIKYAKGEKLEIKTHRTLSRHEDDPEGEWTLIPGGEKYVGEPQPGDHTIIFMDFSRGRHRET